MQLPCKTPGFISPKTRNGVVLTADLCPSNLPVDKNFFKSYWTICKIFKRPVPIALCVSGLWLEKHIEDVKWIKNLEAKSLLSITWINHSYYHRFLKDIQLQNNFLLLSDTNIDIEVLSTEKKMLQSGIIPSVFFPFSRACVSRGLFLKITGYGLIPVGSNAWLAKDQWPRMEALYSFMRTAMNRRVSFVLKKLLKVKEKILIINAGIYMTLMKAWQQI